MASGEESSDLYPTQNVVTCEDCGEHGEVPWYCKNCPGSLCQKCKEAHQRSGILKKHSIVPRTGIVMRTYGPAKIAEGCNFHPEKDISTYCNDCEVPCCASCLVEQHQRHSLSLIEDKYLSAETRLNDHIKELENNVLGKLVERKNQLQDKVTESKKYTEKVSKEISTFEEEVVEAVRKTFDGFRQRVKSSTDVVIAKVHDTDIEIQRVKRVIEDCEKRIRIGKLDIIEYSPPPAESHIPIVTFSTPSLPCFVPNRNIFEGLEKLLGNVENDDSTTHAKSEDESIEHRVVPKFSKSMLSVKKINSFHCTFNGLAIFSVEHNKAWIMYHSSDTMHMYDVHGNLIRSKTVNKNCSINDLAIKRSGDMVVSTQENKIRQVSSDGSVSSLIDTKPLIPAGLCLSETEEIVVCLRGQQDNASVTVYSCDGKRKLRKMRGRSSNGNFCITDPFRVVQVENMYCIVNYMRNTVCVDKNDSTIWQYEGQHAILQKSFQPLDIDKDRYNNLLITDGKNHCVHYMDMAGDLLRLILTKEEIGLDYHWGISVNKKTGEVWLGNSGTSDIVVASYLSNNCQA